MLSIVKKFVKVRKDLTPDRVLFGYVVDVGPLGSVVTVEWEGGGITVERSDSLNHYGTDWNRL